MSTEVLLLIAVLAVSLLLFLVIKLKISAFVSLLLVSVATAFATGIDLDKIMPLLISGMGSTLGSITIIVGLGAILCKMIEVSGGADSLATYFSRLLGVKKTVAAITIAGFILGIPIFVDVGFIIFAPIILGFAKINKKNPIVYGLPVAIAMLAVHVVVPPHPGPVAAANLMKADVGLLTLLGILICIPTSIVGFFVAKKLNSIYKKDEPLTSNVNIEDDSSKTDNVEKDNENSPSVFTILSLIIIPIALIMIGTVSLTVLDKESSILPFTQLLGSPGFALLISLGLAFYFLGIRRNWSYSKIGKVMDSALPTAAVVIMVTGAGGVFGKVLAESGVGTALADTLNALNIPILPAAFLITAVLRASQGSATVAILTTAGLLSNSMEGLDDTYRVLVTIAIGFGGMALSHINDSFFWIFTKYLNISVLEGIKIWTVLSTITAVTGFIFCYILYLILI